MILQELDNYVASGSKVKVVAANRQQVNGIGAQNETENAEEMNSEERSNGNGCNGYHFQNLKIDVEEGDITERTTLNAVLREGYQHVIVLSEPTEDAVDAQHIDARTLITLLHLRDIVDKNGKWQWQ